MNFDAWCKTLWILCGVRLSLVDDPEEVARYRERYDQGMPPTMAFQRERQWQWEQQTKGAET